MYRQICCAAIVAVAVTHTVFAGTLLDELEAQAAETKKELDIFQRKVTEPRAIGGHDSAYASNATLAPDARGVVQLFRYTKRGDGIRVIGPHDFCAMRGEANIEDGDHCTVSSGGNGYWQIHVDGGTCYVQCFDLY